MQQLKWLLFIFIVFCAKSMAFAADTPVYSGQYYNWHVYKLFKNDGEKICYIASFTQKQIGNYKAARKPYIMVSYFKSKEKEEFSTFGDYTFKLNSIIYLAIDSSQYKLLTKGKLAWLKTSMEDKQLIDLMLKASDDKEMRIRGETTNGEYTIDYYSMQGFLPAYNKMKTLCDE